MDKPQNAYDYFINHKEKFEQRSDEKMKKIYMIAGIVCVVLLIFPIIPLPNWLVRVAVVIGGLYCGFKYMYDTDYYNKESGGKIESVLIKKFLREEVSLDDAVKALEKKDIKFLADATPTTDVPVQLYVYEDKVGKEYYCQIMNYYAADDFRGASDVVVLSDDEYDKYKDLINSMKS
ncbi:MAG: hypothetical protein LBL47_04890 [Lactobacillus sp.]|nr:hypothetical protein [Lactobacillus sp.]